MAKHESDSRIVPTLLTQSSPGELFILRNAGNLVPPHGTQPNGEAATIEFAVAGLGVRNIVVCGHSQCGAMKALLDPEKTQKLPAMRGWLAHAEATRRIMEDHYPDLDPAARLAVAAEENVLVQIENLRTHPAVASALAARRISIHGWVYEIESGEVYGYDHHVDDFVDLTPETKAPRPPRLRPGRGEI
jgi:carbonic anhydrase